MIIFITAIVRFIPTCQSRSFGFTKEWASFTAITAVSKFYQRKEDFANTCAWWSIQRRGIAQTDHQLPGAWHWKNHIGQLVLLANQHEVSLGHSDNRDGIPYGTLESIDAL